MRAILIAILAMLLAGGAWAQEFQQIVEYVPTTQKVCEGGVCRLVTVNRPVVRTVRVAAAAVATVTSDLASVATAPVRLLSGCGCPDCTCGPGCTCGSNLSVRVQDSFSDLTAAEAEVMSVVGYQNIRLASGMSLWDRIRTRRMARRAGRLAGHVNFAATGVNRRLLNLSAFFPRAWFNLR